MIDLRTAAKLTCCVALALGTGAAVAQQKASAPNGQQPGDLDQIRKVSTLIGTNIMNHTNTKIANLRDLALSREGAAEYAVLGWGGVAGVNETYIAVPFDLLGVRHDDGKWAVNLDMTTEDLKRAPTIKSENYHELLDAQWIARVDQFIHSYGASRHHPNRTVEAGQQDHRIVERVLLATKMIGVNIVNTQKQELGKVEDLLLDRMDRVAFMIIGRGGVLGVGENYVPIPWSKLILGENRENAAVTVVIDASKPQLEKAPLVKGDNYATLLARGFADQVRKYFGMTSDTLSGSAREKK